MDTTWGAFLVTTDPGLEDIAVAELQETRRGAPADERTPIRPGHLILRAASPAVVLGLRTIHHVSRIRIEAGVATLDDVRRVASGLELPELARAASFRVTSRCFGEPAFDCREVQGAVGAALQRRYGTRVDLEAFELEVRANVYGGRLVAGIQLTRDSLSSRIRRAGNLRSSLRPTTAAALVRLAGAHRGPGRLIDPMCGAGVIPLEAHAINPELDVSASDWDGPTVELARGTFRNHGVALDVRVGDVRSLGESGPGFDYILTDPPYGMHLGKRARLGELYRATLVAFRRALNPAGRVALVVLKHRTFEAAIEASGLRVTHRRVIEAGGVKPTIVVLESAARRDG